MAYQVAIQASNGSIVLVTNAPVVDEINGEISLYRVNGNSDVFVYSGRTPEGVPIVGKFKRTDYRS